MTDDDKIKAVTAKLIGEFYVGQRVKSRWSYNEGTVVAIMKGRVLVQLDASYNGPIECLTTSLMPLYDTRYDIEGLSNAF